MGWEGSGRKEWEGGNGREGVGGRSEVGGDREEGIRSTGPCRDPLGCL